MSATFTVSLEGLRFYAPHGVYGGEALTGNEFEVNVQLELDGGQSVQQLEQTVNYAEVFELVRHRMQERTALLETLCQQIASDIERDFPLVHKVTIQVKKLTPAIAHFSGSVGVSFTKARNL